MEEVWRTRIIPAPIEFASFISIGGGREGPTKAPRDEGLLDLTSPTQ